MKRAFRLECNGHHVDLLVSEEEVQKGVLANVSAIAPAFHLLCDQIRGLTRRAQIESEFPLPPGVERARYIDDMREVACYRISHDDYLVRYDWIGVDGQRMHWTAEPLDLQPGSPTVDEQLGDRLAQARLHRRAMEQ